MTSTPEHNYTDATQPPPKWASEAGDWTQIRTEHLEGMDHPTEVIHLHPNHPEYYDSDDAQVEAAYRAFEDGEAEHFRQRDLETAAVIDQFSNESPGADTSTLQVWDRNDIPVHDELDDDHLDFDEL